ncbi:MAG: glycosyltransferase family 4 protein [Bacteroides sp.]|nr:glycosyltransferase family 4 protein [Bacteroides sp.]
MKVLMFGWEFPPHISGGLGTACFGMCKGLLAQGVKVIFVAPKMHGDEDASVAQLVNASEVEINLCNPIYRELFHNLTYIEVGANLIPYSGFGQYLDLKKVQEGKTVFDAGAYMHQKFDFSGEYRANLMEEVDRYAMVAVKVAQQHDFDVIHAHDWLTYRAGIAAKKATGKPLVIHVHATEFDRSGTNVNSVVFGIEREGMLAADHIITVSNYTRDIVINRYGIDPGKITTVYNAVEPKDSDPQVQTGARKASRKRLIAVRKQEAEKNIPEEKPKRKIVTFLGRVTYQKGPEYFVEAARLVMEKDPEVEFVMAGSGDMLHSIVRRVAALGLGNRFHFTGFLRGADVDRMYGMSSVYVMPSVSEPFGISPLEAMRSNVPVVISKQSGVAEILNHALKVDFWDVDAMADAIYALLHYPALSQMFAEMGGADAKSLKWSSAAEKIKRVYQRVCPF